MGEQKHRWVISSNAPEAEDRYWVFLRPDEAEDATDGSVPVSLDELQEPTVYLLDHTEPMEGGPTPAAEIARTVATPPEPSILLVTTDPPSQLDGDVPTAARRGLAHSRTWTREAPPDVAEPILGVQSSWTTDTLSLPGRHFRCGSASHPGPRAISADKVNEDFAFHGALSCAGQEWIVAGVADGVGQSVWPERAARHAGHAFVETLERCLVSGVIPREEQRLNPDNVLAPWHAPFAEQLASRILTRLRVDLELLSASAHPFLPSFKDGEGHVMDRYRPDLFEKLFYTGSDGRDRIRDRWFQSTLLAVALGPVGGLALLLGDGLARIDRRAPDSEGGGWSRVVRPLESDGRAPLRRVSLWLTPEDVLVCLRKLPRKGAVEVGAVVMTDGVSKSSREAVAAAAGDVGMVPEGEEPLAALTLDSREQCARFLSELSSRKGAELDNMSVGFAYRELEGGR